MNLTDFWKVYWESNLTDYCVMWRLSCISKVCWQKKRPYACFPKTREGICDGNRGTPPATRRVASAFPPTDFEDLGREE